MAHIKVNFYAPIILRLKFPCDLNSDLCLGSPKPCLVEWLNSVLPDVRLPPGASLQELRDFLHDGTVLCVILNKLYPGSIEMVRLHFICWFATFFIIKILFSILFLLFVLNFIHLKKWYLVSHAMVLISACSFSPTLGRKF